jgi:hypothetical protein
MQKSLDTYETRFCTALRDWFENEYKPGKKGPVSACAKFLKVSQGHLSMILKGEKCWRSEEERRAIANKIGRSYEDMIGITRREPGFGTCEPVAVYESQPKKNLKTIDAILQMTREVLESDTDYAESLSANVRSFHNAVQTQKRLNRLEAEVFDLKSKLHAILVNDRRKTIRRKEQIEFEGPERRINPDRRGR